MFAPWSVCGAEKLQVRKKRRVGKLTREKEREKRADGAGQNAHSGHCKTVQEVGVGQWRKGTGREAGSLYYTQ